MYIEDILDRVINSAILAPRIFNYNILQSFYEQNNRNNGLTQKQRNLLEKIFRQHAKKISEILGHDVSNSLDHPQYRLALRQLDQGRYISLENDQKFGKKFKISFPYDKNVITEIQTTRDQTVLCNWDPENRAWTMPLIEKNILYVQNLAKKHEFSVSEEVNSYFHQIDTVIADIENHVPVVVEENNDFILKNFNGDSTLSGSNLIEKLFDARKKAVVHWNTEIEEKLEKFDTSEVIKLFLKSSPNEKFVKKLDENGDDDIAIIIKNLNPCLVVIPVSASLSYLEKTMKIMEKIGISCEEQSVMFRLPNSTDKDFNQFVKDQKLNNPINEKTRIVYVSGKVTKPIFESRMYFHSVLSYNAVFPHYIISNYLKNQANIITIE